MGGGRETWRGNEGWMDYVFLLAQMDTAEKGIGLIQTIVNGGAALILAVVAVVCGVLFYRQLKANSALEREFRNQVRVDAESKSDAQKEQYQMMLQREHEVQEGQLAAIQAVETFSTEMRELKTVIKDVVLRISRIEDDIRRFPRGS